MFTTDSDQFLVPFFRVFVLRWVYSVGWQVHILIFMGVGREIWGLSNLAHAAIQERHNKPSGIYA